MAWVRIGDALINMDSIGSVEFRQTDAGWWMMFRSWEGEYLFMWNIRDEEVEKIKQALTQATKAVKIKITQPTPALAE